MIFAAGLGTRLKPLTDRMPKALVPVGGHPLLWHVLTKLKAAGFQRVVVNVHHFSRQIIDYLAANDFGIDVHVSDETGQLLETGGGIRKARHLFSPQYPILIHNVDILSNVDLAALMTQAESLDNPGALLVVSSRPTSRYLLFGHDMQLVGWTNVDTAEVKTPFPHLDVAACRKYAFSGIHVFSPSLFPLMDDCPPRFPIMDFYLKHCHRAPIRGVVKEDLRLLDVGKLDTLERANQFLRCDK